MCDGDVVHYIFGKNEMADQKYTVIFDFCFSHLQQTYNDLYRGKEMQFDSVEDIKAHVDKFLDRCDKLKAFL
jgi:hypothetical protein